MTKLGILVCAGALMFSGSSVMAQAIDVVNNANSASQSGASSTAIAYGGGNNSPSKIRTTVPAISPGLVAAGVHSCAGSTSVGVGATGWGFGFGSTYEMRECNRRAYASALAGLGHRSAALDLVCLNKEVRSSLNATGIVCPSQGVIRASAAPRYTTAVAAAEPTVQRATVRQPANGKRTYSAKALGLTASDLRAKGCVIRNDPQKGSVWFCAKPVL